MLKKLWNMWQVKEIIACLFILVDGGIVATDCCGQYSFLIGVLVGMPGFFMIGDAFRNADKYEKEHESEWITGPGE